MALPLSLDLDLLRTFVAIAEEKSFTRAADRVGRTQSAVSLQMQRLETVVEQKLLDRGKGGSVELTAFGQALLVRARDLLAMNDGILSDLRKVTTSQSVRFGIDGEFSPRAVSEILRAFADRAPDVEVEVMTGASCAVAMKFKSGELDLAILKEGLEPRQWAAELVRQERMTWVSSIAHRQHLQEVLPVALSTRECEWLPPWLTECLYSSRVQRAVEKSGRRHRIAARSASTPGMLALVMSGVAVIATPESSELPEGLCRVWGDGLPDLPIVDFLMLKAREPRQPMTDMLLSEIRSFHAQLAETGRQATAPPPPP